MHSLRSPLQEPQFACSHSASEKGNCQNRHYPFSLTPFYRQTVLARFPHYEVLPPPPPKGEQAPLGIASVRPQGFQLFLGEVGGVGAEPPHRAYKPPQPSGAGLGGIIGRRKRSCPFWATVLFFGIADYST